ncbi:MAG: molybdenum cofactor biosynthesis enzyme, partial [Coriobacteriia bacterium]|nr:molybdenum cofactor biosynthesis enzyme [Coriobacteriia bacterium]
MGLRVGKPFWQDDELDDGGFSTVGVALALLISLSLVFAGAQVYRVQSAAAEIQEVADAAALAADNVVAEYYLVARVCDALVLSLSLTGIVVLGMGVAALCSPISATVGSKLIDAGRRVLKARDGFARRAASGLNELQKAVPFLAAAAAYRVAAANKDAGGSPYIGLALAFPFEGEEVSAGDGTGSGSLVDAVDGAADTLKRAGEEAEKAAREAKGAKERGYQADCGAHPGYCLFERAASLAHLQGVSNPYFGSVETWGFSVALNRAKAYYPVRLAMESPVSDSLDEQVNSALRKRFYEYAAQVVGEGFVTESGDAFEADFPLLPKNTAEMKETRLYTDAVYPVTVNESGLREMHAWDGCPRAAGSIGRGSLAQREGEGYALCPTCEFTAESLGAVAAASSSINNGFEYHYRIIAQAAQEYEEARKGYDPKAQTVRRIAGTLFDRARDALHSMASQRIAVAPPGRFGMVSIVMSTGALSSQGGFASRFVADAGELGTRVAIAGATLVSDSPEQGRTVISSILDGLRKRTDSRLLGVFATVMDVWSD